MAFRKGRRGLRYCVGKGRRLNGNITSKRSYPAHFFIVDIHWLSDDPLDFLGFRNLYR